MGGTGIHGWTVVGSATHALPLSLCVGLVAVRVATTDAKLLLRREEEQSMLWIVALLLSQGMAQRR